MDIIFTLQANNKQVFCARRSEQSGRYNPLQSIKQKCLKYNLSHGNRRQPIGDGIAGKKAATKQLTAGYFSFYKVNYRKNIISSVKYFYTTGK